MSAHEKHQKLAVTLFRCTLAGRLCGCSTPCQEALRGFHRAFERDPTQPLHLGDDQERGDDQ